MGDNWLRFTGWTTGGSSANDNWIYPGGNTAGAGGQIGGGAQIVDAAFQQQLVYQHQLQRMMAQQPAQQLMVPLPPPCPESNLAWLNRRVQEMQVSL